MKPAEKKEQFILLRAEGWSYSKIAKELGISKSTCTKWQKALAEPIREARDGRLQDLYTLYRVGKEAHIKTLGETIKRIEEALEKKDLTEIPADKLLKLKLEYEDRLQAQHTEPTEGGEAFTEYTTEEMLKAVAGLYERIKAGSITPQQAKTELTTLEGVRRAISEHNTEW